MQSLIAAKLLLVVIFLGGCANQPSSYWQVAKGDRDTLAFSGKGAAAGMMMDTYMSGAGTAIGIAIDEGIAKEIAANMQRKSPDVTIVSVVQRQLAEQSKNPHAQVCTQGSRQVIVDTHGFHTFAGEGDKVSAWLKMRFMCNGKETLINYPADFPSPKLAELSDVKTNPEIAVGLLNDAVYEVVQVWNQSPH